ncbi:MAG: cell division protein FtsA [Minisyncoccia bacterium]
MSNKYLAIDLGSHSIKALVASLETNGWRVLLPILRKSRGIKGGEIEEIEAVAEDLEGLLGEIEGLLKGAKFKSAVVGINSSRIEIRNSKGSSLVSRADGVISLDDKERADKSAEVISLENNRTLVQTVIRDYIIDGSTRVKDPIGLNGLKLEAEAILLDVFSPVIKNLEYLKEAIGINLSPKFILAYAGSELALNKQDKELGALALDLGASTTSMAVYENGQLLDLKVLPIGGNHITSDIAIGLKVPFDVAEEIKIKEGIALTKKVERGESFDLKDYYEEIEAPTKITKKYLVEIIEARLGEIFDKVSERLKQLSRYQKLAGGVVLYGGGAKMNGIKELVKEKLKLSIKLAKPEIEWYKDNPDPIFVPVLGLMDLRLKNQENVKQLEKGGFSRKFSDILKSLFNW